MNTREMDLLQLEEELLNARKKLNALIQEYHNGIQPLESQASQESERTAQYQDKLNDLETEMQRLNQKLQLLKRIPPETEKPQLQAEAPRPQVQQNVQAIQMPQTAQNLQPQPNRQIQPTPQVQHNQQITQNPYIQQNRQVQPPQTFQNIQPQPVPQKSARKPQEYEKIFGKSFMGIFASVLIFISLIIFATLVLPYLDDIIKMIGLYVISFGILGAGLFLYHKQKNNKFYIAVIGCGTGSLYLSLLLSNLYFKMLGDVALYCFILVWAVLVKNLTRVKNLVFEIIGQVGIFIATILGTILCVSEGDETKFLVLTVFYLLSSCVFSEIDKAYLQYMIRARKSTDGGQTTTPPPYYEHRFCSHICKSLNVGVFLIGFSLMDTSGVKTAGVLLLMLYLLLEYYLTFREDCKHGLAFQMLTVANTFLMIGLWSEVNLISSDYSDIFIYLAAIAVLIYTEIKNAPFKLYTLIWCSIIAFWGCCSNSWMRQHLYVYLTVIPCLLYGKWKNRKMYLNTGIVYLGGLWMVILTSYEYHGYRSIECFIMIAAVCAAFLYACHKAEFVGVKIAGYILLCLTIIEFVDDAAYTLMKDYNAVHFNEIAYISSKAKLITFFTVALIHLLLSKLEYFGSKKPVQWMMFTINAMLMFAGCISMHDIHMSWQIPTILITVLLFVINSKRLLPKHRLAGYYIAFKYTVLMLNILGSFDAENYFISICLLLFAIASIVAGFYKDTASFRMYGLILSMISVIKLILIDIHYDSTLETALSFFVCGVLCFIISFIYHKIDIGFKNKESSDS